jgi:hypothetical protein
MTTYYVSSEIGNANNAGTSAAATLAFLQAAANLVKPGGTIEVMNGPQHRDVLDIIASGTVRAPDYFPEQTPLINGSGGWNAINIGNLLSSTVASALRMCMEDGL